MSGYESNSVLASTVALPAAGDFPVPVPTFPEELTPNLHAYFTHLGGEVSCVKIVSTDRPCT